MKRVYLDNIFCFKLFVAGILIFFTAFAFSQTTLQVMTRQTEKEFEYLPSDKLSIRAERGVINIRKSNDVKVKVILRLVAKNQQQDIAKKELNYIHYNLTKAGKEIILSNYLQVPSNVKSDEVSSILRAEYDILIPEKSKVSINNSFGIVQVQNVDVSIDADLEYCDVSLNQVRGVADLKVNVGDIQCSNSAMDGTLNTYYSNISLNNTSGNLKLITQGGSLYANLNGNLSLLDIRANRTEIMLVNRACKPYKLSLKSDYAMVNISQACYGLNDGVVTNQSVPGKEHYSIESRPADAEQTIRIISSSGNIMLN